MRQRWPLIRIIKSATAARSMQASEHKGDQFGNTFAELDRSGRDWGRGLQVAARATCM